MPPSLNAATASIYVAVIQPITIHAFIRTTQSRKRRQRRRLELADEGMLPVRNSSFNFGVGRMKWQQILVQQYLVKVKNLSYNFDKF